MNNQVFVTKLSELAERTDTLSAPATQGESTPAADWLSTESFEGQLAVDVYQTPREIIIKSTIAGVRPEDIDISVNNDMVTIKGVRRAAETVAEEEYFYKECYWGGFSRSIILPVDIRDDRVEATLKNGVLTVVLPKAGKSKVKVVRVKEEV